MASPCSRCGTFLGSASDTLYSDAGDVLCLPYRERLDQERRDTLDARRMWTSSWGALLGAIAGLPVALIFVLGAMAVSVPAVGAAWSTLLSLSNATPGAREKLGSRIGFVRFAATAGAFFGGLGILAMIIQLVLVLFRLATQPH